MLSAERAEDVIQQAFLRALRAMRADERPLDLRPWLYTIAHNAALNALRDRTVPSDTLEEEIDGVERPEQAFERREGLREVVAAVGALPERQRDALVLRELEGRSYEEIAVKLGVSDGAVRQLLNRARNPLRAGVTAVTPYGLLAGLPAGAETPLVGRIAELTAAGAGAGAAAAKLTATALVTGAVVGGVAAVPEEGRSSGPEAAVGDAREQARKVGDAAQEATQPAGRAGRRAAGTDRPGAGRGDDEGAGSDGRSGRRGGDDERRRDDRSGPGSDGDEPHGDSSGPGSGDSSGSGGDGDSSGPGSGEGSGSGGGGSGSSGSRDSGSGSSGSGSDSSGFSSSGSGTGSSGSGSGSGSSGSGG